MGGFEGVVVVEGGPGLRLKETEAAYSGKRP